MNTYSLNEEFVTESVKNMSKDVEEYLTNREDRNTHEDQITTNLQTDPLICKTEEIIDNKNYLQPENEKTKEDESCGFKVFNIVLEEEISFDEEHRRTEHIYYLPLAIGSANTCPETLGKEFIALTESNHQSDSDKILHDLGKSLICRVEKMTGNESKLEDDACKPSEQVDASTEEIDSTANVSDVATTDVAVSDATSTATITTASDNTNTTTVTTAPLILLVPNIAQQFNQIAKLNKSSLRSKRTVRTTCSRLHPLSDSKRQASFEDTQFAEPASCSDVDITTLLISSTTGQKNIDSQKSLQKDLLKDTYHARFHSDDITTLQDYSIKPQAQSNTDPEQIHIENRDADHSNSSSDKGYAKNRNSNVFRSKSALSTIPPNRREQHSKVGHQSEPSSQGTNSVYRQSPLLASENLLHSQGQSSGLTASEEGSSSSLPSLDTGGSSSTGGGCSSGQTQAEEDRNTREKLSTNDRASSHSPSETSRLPVESDKRISHVTQGARSDDTNDSQSDSLSASIADKKALVLSRRRHTVKELIHVEKEYVSALTTLVNVYMIPLNKKKFLMINKLIQFLQIGDKLLDMFSREAVAMCYCTFVDNFSNSEKTLETCWNTKSSFQKFCELKLRMNRNKLPLKALLVQPVQRIPRYELLVKRLLESTPKDYSDHALLIEAESAIHRLALRVNAVHAAGEDENIVDGIKLIEKLLAPATLTPTRQYVRHDIVSVEERKDPVCIFMFTDQIIFTVARRRGSQVIKKPIFLRLQSIRGVDAIENIKYKIYDRLGIEAIELESRMEIGTEPTGHHKEVRDKKDLALLAEIENISARLDYRHYDLDAVVRQMYMSIQKELEDLRTARNTATPMPGNISIFTATSKEGIERYELMFPNKAKRKEWEKTVLELKRQLSSIKRMAKFNEAIQIPRTLPGIQLSCASAIESSPLIAETPCDVWLCASDGYTGYICLFTAHPKPDIYFNIPLSGCTSRITCICAIPGFIHHGMRRTSYSLAAQNIRSRCGVEKKRSGTTDLPLLEVDQAAVEENSQLSKSDETAKVKIEENSPDDKTHKLPDSEFDKTTKMISGDFSNKIPESTTGNVVERKSSISQDVSSGSYSNTPPDTPTNAESTLKLSDGDEPRTGDLQVSKSSNSHAESNASQMQKSESVIPTDSNQCSTQQTSNLDSQKESGSVIAVVYASDPDEPTSNESDSSDISETEGDLTQPILSETFSDNSSSKETDTYTKANRENKRKDSYSKS
ncbi:unnamed protein product [Heterobilharzia americana]|nr:unnamed protein product [Heterobilharzia americana]